MSSETQEPRVISLAEFDACALEGPLAALNQVDMISISSAYQQAAATAPSPSKEVFGLLGEIAAIHLTPAERGRIWGPIAQRGDQRTMLPADIRGKQSEILETVLPRIVHPALRARVADIVWTNDLRKGGVAKIAVEAYCDCVEGLLNG